MFEFMAVNAVGLSSVNIPTVASMSAQVSARPNKVAGNAAPQIAGQGKDALEIKQKEKPDLLVNLKAIEAQIAARAKEAANVNALDISYNKKEALLSVKVEQQQTGQLIRELQFKDYKAMAYSSHGYKGAYVDLTA
jgi:hypothetical protein